MNELDLQHIDAQIKAIICHIGKLVKGRKLDTQQVEEKKHARDLVTNVDKAVQDMLTKNILSIMPKAIVFGEESTEQLSHFDIPSLWILDPIDGTSNFVKQRKDYAIMLAYFENLVPKLSYIYDVEQEVLYSAVRGKGVFVNGEKIERVSNLTLNQSLASIFVRKFYEVGNQEHELLIREVFDVRFGGCLGIDAAKVATGQFGAFISPRIAPWDFAPFFLFAQEQDLHLSTFEGDTLDLHQVSSIIFSTKQFYEDWNTLKLKNVKNVQL